MPIDYSETETRDRFVTNALEEAGWDKDPYVLRREFPISEGRIVARQGQAKRGNKKHADYLLRYGDSIPLAIVEAKKYEKGTAEGIQQAKDYALRLQVPLAYVTNGQEIIELDMITGHERRIENFPSPEVIWEKRNQVQAISDETLEFLLQPSQSDGNKAPRYYQELAINSTIEAIGRGQKRILLTMATGTGKTFLAFQICWKLWNSKWNSTGQPNKRPKILFLADRRVLIDDPKDKTFTPFGSARHKITSKEVTQGREMFFALYQSLVGSNGEPNLYEQYRKDFFDLIIIDEAHRGSANEESSWRQVLDYFKPAYHLGLTATPRRDDNVDTYEYFGNPIYEYSLRQGIEDGYLAPYTVHRVITNYDQDGWRPKEGQTDRFGKLIPDREYNTEDFDQIVAINPRTEAIAQHLTQFLKDNDLRFAKTIIFCVDQEHANEMRRALHNANLDLAQQYPNYVARITSDEGQIGRNLLSEFQDPEKIEPVLVTTSQLLTTGVDIPTCRNIVLVRAINGMTDFKQIIGRGTRVRDDYNKLYFNILDYAGSATDRFRDPDFDGYPARITEIAVDEDGNIIEEAVNENTDPTAPDIEFDEAVDATDLYIEHRQKYLVDKVEIAVEVVGHAVWEIDAEGNRLRVVRYDDYTASQVRTLYTDSNDLREQWANPDLRGLIIQQLNDMDIDFRRLAEVTNQPEADPFDLLCHLAFDAPLLTRRERAIKLKTEAQEFFAKYSEAARIILDALLEQYAEHGVTEFNLGQVLKIEPFTKLGSFNQIVNLFGGPKAMNEAVQEMQKLLYAA